MKHIFKSRKFYAALAALAVAMFGQRAGISAELLNSAIQSLMAYIIGTALEDGLRARQ